MTEYIQAFWLALLQGLTEFLPVSSSGHLVLLPKLAGWQDQGLAFDVAVHAGTLVAVLVYFFPDIRRMLVDWTKSLGGGEVTPYSRLAWSILFATVMVGAAGLLLQEIVNNHLRDPVPVAIATLVFGVLLGAADRWGPKQRSVDEIGWKDVVVIGAAQVLALVPGTSRSGITITAGLAMGLTRDAAARFSFLLAIPVIILASSWQLGELLSSDVPINWGVLVFATLVSALVALLTIHWFLGFVQRFSLLPFVIYRLALGMILLIVFM
jgi:undecaprenyl-diphosphatase